MAASRWTRKTEASLVPRLQALGPSGLVWATAAVLGVGFLALIAYELLRPRDLYTGTNHTGTALPALTVPADHTACVRGLDVPAGTGRIEFAATAAGMPVVVDALVTAGRRSTARAVQVPVGGGELPVEVSIPKRPRSPPAVAGQICLRPRAASLTLWGRGGVQVNQVPPTLDGVPQQNRVAVWFRPPAGEHHSLLSALPAMARRAALFRPGIVGPWTYWAILGLTPVLSLAGVWMLARAARERTFAHEPLVVGAIAFALAASWALITPAFDAPDETEHIAYAQSVAENGRAPETDRTRHSAYSSELRVAFEGIQVAGFFGQTDGRPPWLKRDQQRWRTRQAAHPSPSDDAGISVAARYTPLYYAALAPAYLLAGNSSIWSRITLMRLVSALLGAIAAAATFLLVRELLPRPRWAATAAGLLVAFQPMFAFISGAVNNDAGVNAAGAVLLLLLVRALRRGVSIRLAAGIGITMALLPLAKGNGFLLYPAAAVGLAGALSRYRLGLRPIATLAATFALVAAAWVPATLALHHHALPTNLGWRAASPNEYPTRVGPAVTVRAAVHHPLKFASYLWQEFLPPLPGTQDLRPPGFPHPGYTVYVKRGWASFGFISINFPGWIYAAIAAALAMAAAAGLAALVRERAAVRRRTWEIAVLAIAVLGVWVGSEAAYFVLPPTSLAVFGRYLFPAIAALAAIAVGCCFGTGRRWAPATGAAAVVSVMALQWGSQLLTMSSLYA